MSDKLASGQRPVDVLFFSRGRGRGHAIVDIAITEELKKLLPDVDVRLVSYGTGLGVLLESWGGALDLDISENEPTVETLVRATQVISQFQPLLVVAHEEVAALPAAKVFGKPAVFLTDWFMGSRDFDMTLLEYANQILFMDEEGIFEEPESAAGRVQYYPPVLRSLKYTAADRPRARRELGISQDAVVVTVFIHPGRRTEDVMPIFDIVEPAFRAIGTPDKRLFWLTEDDPVLSERAAGNSDIVIQGPDQPFDRLMVASDVGITKGNRSIVFELSALAVPSISFTDQWNGIDDFRTARIPTNSVLPLYRTSAARFRNELVGALDSRAKFQSEVSPWKDGREPIAARLAEIVDHLRRVPRSAERRSG